MDTNSPERPASLKASDFVFLRASSWFLIGETTPQSSKAFKYFKLAGIACNGAGVSSSMM